MRTFMKKTSILLLLLCLFLLASCTEAPVTPTQHTEQPHSTALPVEQPEATEPVEQTQTATEPQTTAVPPETTQEPERGSDGITHGKVRGKNYTCDWLGLNYTLPMGHQFYTEAQLAQIQGLSAKTITDEDMARVLDATSYFIDMQTYGTGPSVPYVMLAYQDLDAFGPVSDAADYFNKSKDPTIQMFESYGFTDVSFEVEDYVLDGVNCASAVICAYSGETLTYQRMVGVIRGHYVAMITAAGNDDTADDLFLGFHWQQPQQ